MIDMQEPQSLFSLWLAQFGVANRTLGKVIKISLVLLLPYILLAAALYALKPTNLVALVLCAIVFVIYTLFLAFGSPLMLMRIFTADIENIPEPLISFKKVRISEIPESLFGKNGSDGIIAQRIDPITAQRLVDEGKEIGAAIKKKAILMEVGIGTLIGAALGVGGYYMYNRKDDESTDDETVVTTENEDDVIDVEPVEDIVVVSTDEM